MTCNYFRSETVIRAVWILENTGQSAHLLFLQSVEFQTSKIGVLMELPNNINIGC